MKGKASFSFRDPQTNLQAPPLEIRDLPLPNMEELKYGAEIEKFLSRSINFFYQCGAVHEVSVASRGPHARHIRVELRAGNVVAWLEPHLPRLLERIRQAKLDCQLVPPDSIIVSAPDQPCAIAGNPRVEGKFGEGDIPETPRRSLTKRVLLPQFDVGTLRELMGIFEVEFAGARRKDELVDTLVRARRVSLEDILQRVNVDVLRQICREAGCERPGRGRDDVLESLWSVYESK